MTNLELTGYILLAIAFYAAMWALGTALLFFLIRLQFIGWFIRSAASSQMLHGPTTITRCLLYGNAAYERWRAFKDNDYSVENLTWPKDALDATVPAIREPMGMPPPSPVRPPRQWPPVSKPQYPVPVPKLSDLVHDPEDKLGRAAKGEYPT